MTDSLKKTDNHNPSAKINLRLYFLRKYHPEGTATVFECCQGQGVLWREIGRQYKVKSHWGVDLKPKKGRLKIDSVRVLEQGLPHNVIDVDTYGNPWSHWEAILHHLVGPTTIFLTIGLVKMAGGFQGRPCKAVESALNLPPSTPPTVFQKLASLSTEMLLAKGQEYSTIIEAVEAVSIGNARYIGVRVEPKVKVTSVN